MTFVDQQHVPLAPPPSSASFVLGLSLTPGDYETSFSSKESLSKSAYSLVVEDTLGNLFQDITRSIDECLLNDEEWKHWQVAMRGDAKGKVNGEELLNDLFDDGFPDWPEDEEVDHAH